MPSQTKSPTIWVNDPIGIGPFVGAANALLLSDDVKITSTNLTDPVAGQFFASAFVFLIPTDHYIYSFQIEIERSGTGARGNYDDTFNFSVPRLVKPNGTGQPNIGFPTKQFFPNPAPVYPAADALHNYGTVRNTAAFWNDGIPITAAQVNDVNFQVLHRVQNNFQNGGGIHTVNFDFIRLTIQHFICESFTPTSRWIQLVKWCPTDTLYITFETIPHKGRGGTWKYEGVTRAQYLAFRAAPSAGKHARGYVDYPSVKVG